MLRFFFSFYWEGNDVGLFVHSLAIQNQSVLILNSHWFFNDKSPNNKAAEIQRETFTGPGTAKHQGILGALFETDLSSDPKKFTLLEKACNLSCSVTNRNMVLVLKNKLLVSRKHPEKTARRAEIWIYYISMTIGGL